MLTIDKITKHIKSIEFTKMGEKTTVCLITLDNGFEVVGSSACIDPKDFDDRFGQLEARGNAIDKLWDLYGFLEHNNKK